MPRETDSKHAHLHDNLEQITQLLIVFDHENPFHRSYENQANKEANQKRRIQANGNVAGPVHCSRQRNAHPAHSDDSPVAHPDPGSRQLSLVNDAVFYEIDLRSFYDSNSDGIGDFNGLIEKLDYLNDGDSNTTPDLGFTGIWLKPIHQSPSTTA